MTRKEAKRFELGRSENAYMKEHRSAIDKIACKDLEKLARADKATMNHTKQQLIAKIEKCNESKAKLHKALMCCLRYCEAGMVVRSYGLWQTHFWQAEHHALAQRMEELERTLDKTNLDLKLKKDQQKLAIQAEKGRKDQALNKKNDVVAKLELANQKLKQENDGLKFQLKTVKDDLSHTERAKRIAENENNKLQEKFFKEKEKVVHAQAQLKVLESQSKIDLEARKHENRVQAEVLKHQHKTDFKRFQDEKNLRDGQMVGALLANRGGHVNTESGTYHMHQPSHNQYGSGPHSHGPGLYPPHYGHGNYPPPNYPPQGNYPPQQGNYPPQGTYPPRGNYPPPHHYGQGNYPPPPFHNQGNYHGRSNCPPPPPHNGRPHARGNYNNHPPPHLAGDDRSHFSSHRQDDAYNAPDDEYYDENHSIHDQDRYCDDVRDGSTASVSGHLPSKRSMARPPAVTATSLTLTNPESHLPSIRRATHRKQAMVALLFRSPTWKVLVLFAIFGVYGSD